LYNSLSKQPPAKKKKLPTQRSKDSSSIKSVTESSVTSSTCLTDISNTGKRKSSRVASLKQNKKPKVYDGNISDCSLDAEVMKKIKLGHETTKSILYYKYKKLASKDCSLDQMPKLTVEEKKEHKQKRKEHVDHYLEQYQLKINDYENKIEEMNETKKNMSHDSSTYKKLTAELKRLEANKKKAEENFNLWKFYSNDTNNVKKLRYLPPFEDPRDKKVSKEKFIATIENVDGKTKKMEHKAIPTELVLFDFHPKFIYQVMNESIEGSWGGSVLPAEDNIAVMHNKDNKGVQEQVLKLKYQVIDKKGNQLKNPIWKVITDTYEDIADEGWVERNFEKKFLDKIKNLHKGKCVTIKAGNVNENPLFEDSKLKKEMKPKNSFHQDKERNCLAFSWANALAYFQGHDKLVKKSADLAWQWSTSLDYNEIIQRTNELFFDYCAFEIDTNYDPVTEHHKQPTLLVLKASDGGISHAVSTCGEWLFDSNLDVAHVISKELLDWCVSTDDQACEFIGIHWGMRIHRNMIHFEFNGRKTNYKNSVAQFFCFCGLNDYALHIEAEFEMNKNIGDIFSTTKYLRRSYALRKKKQQQHEISSSDYTIIVLSCGKHITTCMGWIFIDNEKGPIPLKDNLLQNNNWKKIYVVTTNLGETPNDLLGKFQISLRCYLSS